MKSKREVRKLAARQSEGDSEAVERYLKALAHPLKREVETLRKIILESDSRIAEGIKWNAPSFYCGEWFATFDLRSNDWVQIVFHRGAKVKASKDGHYVDDPAGILKWLSNDRCVARFVSAADVSAKRDALTGIVADWVRHLNDEMKQA